MSRMGYLFVLTLLLPFLISSHVPSYGETRPSGPEEPVIYPGKGIGPVKLGEPLPVELPRQMKILKGKGIEFRCVRKEEVVKCDPGGIIEEIYINSPEFYVERSFLRATKSHAYDIYPYYGEGNTGSSSKKGVFTITYSEYGIGFEVMRTDELITAIFVFKPKPYLKGPSIEQFKQFKK